MFSFRIHEKSVNIAVFNPLGADWAYMRRKVIVEIVQGKVDDINCRLSFGQDLVQRVSQRYSKMIRFCHVFEEMTLIEKVHAE